MPSDLETLATRDFILRALRRYPRGVPAATLHAALTMIGVELPPLGPDGLDAQLLYLLDKGLVKREAAAHTGSVELWRLAADGDDYLRGRKLT